MTENTLEMKQEVLEAMSDKISRLEEKMSELRKLGPTTSKTKADPNRDGLYEEIPLIEMEIAHCKKLKDEVIHSDTPMTLLKSYRDASELREWLDGVDYSIENFRQLQNSTASVMEGNPIQMKALAMFLGEWSFEFSIGQFPPEAYEEFIPRAFEIVKRLWTPKKFPFRGDSEFKALRRDLKNRLDELSSDPTYQIQFDYLEARKLADPHKASKRYLMGSIIYALLLLFGLKLFNMFF